MKKWRTVLLFLLLVGILSCSALAAESNVSTAIENGTLKLNIADIDTTDRSQMMSVAVIRSAALNAPTANDIIYANTIYANGQSSLALNIQLGSINVYDYHLIIRDKTGTIAYSQPLAVQPSSQLKVLNVSSGTLSPAFDASVLNYTVSVENSVDSITITAESIDAEATVSGDIGTKALAVGENTFQVKVQPTAGESTTYTIKITRAAMNTPDSGGSSTGGSSTGGSSSGKVDEPVEGTKVFTDVPESHWAAKDIAFVTSRGFFVGTSEKTFSPDAPMTRAQLVTVLYRMAGTPTANGEASFTDVHPNDYYAAAVAWATENGISKGFSEEMFGANNTITREQFATLMYRYAAQQGLDVTQRADLSNFTDSGSVSTYAQDALAWANAVGLINGTGNGLLAPQAQATRSQMAAVIARFFEYQTR